MAARTQVCTVIIDIPDEVLAWAAEQRKALDRRYPEDQFMGSRKEREIGKVGEWAFKQLLEHHGWTGRYDWSAYDEGGLHFDFVLRPTKSLSISVDVKAHTFARLKPVSQTTMTVPAIQLIKNRKRVKPQPDWFFLFIYSEVTKQCRDYGAIDPWVFHEKATRYAEGEHVKGFFVARNDLFNGWAHYHIQIKDWLEALTPQAMGRLF